MKREIPYGVINWETLVRDCYVVDNTGYIRELEKCRTPIFLRPKRFGKSIVCSMLEHYYDVNRKDRFQELFGRFDIGKNPTPLANSFLVLKFDFSTITVGTVAEIRERFFRNVMGANVRTDVAWIRLLAGGAAEARERIRGYIERGEGDFVACNKMLTFARVRSGGRLASLPYYLYYLGYLTFDSPFELKIPNRAVRQVLEDALHDWV